MSFDAPAKGFFLGRYIRDGRKLYYLVNNTGGAMTPVARGAQRKSVYVYNPMDGAITSRPLPTRVNMPPYTALLVVTP